MAYIKFCVIAVETSLKDQSIYITFNKELDSDTLTYQNIILAVNGTVSAPLASYSIILGDDLKTLKLQFTDSPTVNQPYILVLQDKISDLEGNTLDKSLFRNVIFRSSVTSDITLSSPANFEIVTVQNFSWTEKGDNPVNSYRLQVSSDTGFHNVIVDTIIKDKTFVTLGSPLGAGQYFYRVRAEVDGMFGVWSETRTFLVQQGNEYKEESAVDTTEDDEVAVEDLIGDIKDNKITLEEAPKSGVTPTSFTFLFSEDINPSDIKISVIRSDF